MKTSPANAQEQESYLLSRGWEHAMTEEDGCDTWAYPWDKRTDWPESIRKGIHGTQHYWDRAEAVTLQRELDRWQPPIPPDAAKQALDAAIWVTCSPHEWVWTHEQQIAMARYCIEAAKQLALWRWLTEMRCTVQEDSNIDAPKWAVLDVDDEVIGRGESPEAAITNAKESL